MNEETEWAIEDIRKSIHTLNENLSMIAMQLFISNGNFTKTTYLEDFKNSKDWIKNNDN